VQANLDRSQGPSERLRGLHLGLSLQVAKDDRTSILFGQPVDFVVQFGVVHGFMSRYRDLALVDDLGLSTFGGLAPGCLASNSASDAQGYTMQPRSK
jgi:hypothetical protein